MPKSKRNKIVHLTQVKKKGKDHKGDLIKQLEENVAKFRRVYLFDFEDQKADRIGSLRIRMKSVGRIFSGKNSLVDVTLKSIGAKSNIDFEALLKQVVGHRGLLFADIDSDELVAILDKDQPEFCKRLLGYSQLKPNPTASEGGDAKRTTAKGSSRKGAKAKPYEVKFVKL